MKFCTIFIILIYSYTSIGQKLQQSSSSESNFEIRRINMIVDIIRLNLKTNGWSTILCFGNLPDEFYNMLRNESYPFAITNLDREDQDIEDVVRYYSNTIVISLVDIAEYEDTIIKLKNSPYWHPLANIILYYHQKNHAILSKLYFSMWYYRAVNVVIVQYDDFQQQLLLSHYSPYISDGYKLDYQHGCRTTRRIGMPVSGFEEGFICEANCENVSLHSKFRANYLGTCIGFNMITVPYNSTASLTTLNLIEDKSKDYRGFTFRVYASEVPPFCVINDNGNGNYTLGSRDGILWNSMAKLMNFTIDLSPVKDVIKESFNFERQIKHIFDFAFRKADFFLIPIYLFDVVVVEIDFTFPYRESGVCIMSHKAGFVTTLFDAKSIQANRSIIIQFIFCFLCVWITFSIYKGIELSRLSFDQIGRDLLNAIRNVLLITLCNPPKKDLFRLFLTISIWSFFVLNFATQATIISFLTAVKRGRDVDTFEDMIDKGYLIYGMASPDLILPDTEKKFRIINSRLVAVVDLFGCVDNMTQNSDRFCLIDCSVGHYLERNRLNEEGQQYLHIAKDRMHSHYLSIILSKNSPMTERFNNYLIRFYEAGLITKWERYRYADIKEDAPTKPLKMDDLKGMFDLYCYALGFITIIFLLELCIFHTNKWYDLKKKNCVRPD